MESSGQQPRLFQAVEEPGAKSAFLEVVPRVRGPAALVLRLLDEGEVGVRGDGGDPALDEGAVGRGPARGDLGDRRRAVPLEPLRLDLARGHRPREDDLEGPLAESDLGDGVEGGGVVGGVAGGERQVDAGVEEAVERVDLEVELFLESDLAAAESGGFGARGVEGGAGRGGEGGGDEGGGEEGGVLLGEGVEETGDAASAAAREAGSGNVDELRAVVLEARSPTVSSPMPPSYAADCPC